MQVLGVIGSSGPLLGPNETRQQQKRKALHLWTVLTLHVFSRSLLLDLPFIHHWIKVGCDRIKDLCTRAAEQRGPFIMPKLKICSHWQATKWRTRPSSWSSWWWSSGWYSFVVDKVCPVQLSVPAMCSEVNQNGAIDTLSSLSLFAQVHFELIAAGSDQWPRWN